MAKKSRFKFKKFVGFIYLGISIIFVYTLIINGARVYHQRQALVVLEKEKEELEVKKTALAKEVELLADDDYVARYARDNYIFSKDGEEVVKLPESKK